MVDEFALLGNTVLLGNVWTGGAVTNQDSKGKVVNDDNSVSKSSGKDNI